MVSTPHKKAGKDIISKFSSTNSSNELNFLDSTGSFYNPSIPVNLYFCSNKKIGIDNARMLLVENVENFMNFVNSDIEIKNYIEKPIEFNDFKFFILFFDKKLFDSFVEAPSVASVFVSNGIVSYCIFNVEKQQLDDIHSESYQRARGIVEHQNNLQNLSCISN